MPDAFLASQDALLVKQFAEFLLARQRLLQALAPGSADPVRPAMRSACVCFYELARDMLIDTPEEILTALTKTVVLNACRAAGQSLSDASSHLTEGPGAEIIELLNT